METYLYSGVRTPHGRLSIEDRNTGFPSAFPDPYRSGLAEPSPVANMAFGYETRGGPYTDIGGPHPGLHASRTPVAQYHTPALTANGRCTLFYCFFAFLVIIFQLPV